MQRVRRQIGLVDENGNNEYRYTGKGITVAVLDTGMARHPDLTGNVIAFSDFVNRRHFIYDDCGHGTHVCGIIGGNGKLSGGRFVGMAPGCNLVVGKVLDRKGDGSADCMMRGLDWIIKEREHYQIRIINISIGIGTMKNLQKEKMLADKLEELWDLGVLVVCAAGNKGPENGSISALGVSKKMITVGCHDGSYYKNQANRCETYSGRGESGALIRKPDVVAPGTNIISCNSAYRKTGDYYLDAYMAKSGTSMATPIVSGAAALMFEKEPDMTNDMFRQRVTFSATDLGEEWNKQGWGLLNARKLLS